MTARTLELALKKQRLQIASDALRQDFVRHADGLRPVFHAADLAVVGAVWVRRNPQFVVAACVTLLVARPKRAWQWARRAFTAWLAWRKVSELLDRGATI